ncbi:MAG: aerial mycelium formation protein [Actinomycetales bacterium]|nr:aerial mycelium formation protein [Actinomycetales bacterium]
MTEFVAGGRRRIDRVLAPEYLDGLSGLGIEAVRARRAEAQQEEVDLSYARRLLQGRIDLLRAEQARRQGTGPLVSQPHTDEEIVAALKVILCDEQHEGGPSGHRCHGEPSRVGEHRREAERAVADVGGSDLTASTDAALAEALDALSAIEARVSRSRRKVQAVIDTFTDEIARRYRVGEVSLADQA